ncbi:MAG: bifunctional (p)ppGpp synthetase/guanosine-3',5'-bis(diphosphate) 3'-pyrophosphohydrolase [Faecalibacterium sp.]
MEPAEIITYEKLLVAIQETGRTYNMELIEKSYQLADDAHQGIKRRSGEPYVCHPLAVARLLVDLGMDSESIAGALLHDVVEDTAITLEEVKSKFGADVALLVDGVTKLTKIQFSTTEEQQAENLRKMLLAMSQDVRVMIIKLCDRLHNMRTGDAWPAQKRRDKARETMEVYAPIANRLGILNIKEELEDRSLHYLDGVAYHEIQTLLSEHAGEAFLVDVSTKVKERLEENGIHDASMKRRVKSIYGIYRKTYIKNNAFDEVYDIYAVRIVLNDVAECYHALGLIHDMYRPLPNRFKDYISTPKPNGYQSLHTTVVGKEAIPFEVQIRTREMDEMAEYGVAAHWKYKEGVKGKDKLEERLAWVRQLLENQQVADDSGDILSDLKGDLLPEEVFAFTPKGAVINLPAGAICIDFAYAIHSAVGNRMIGCKVNNRIVPIDHQVATGEIIEVIMGPADKGPSRNWLKIVRTSEARNKIRTWFKKMCKEENIEQGRDVLTKEMRREMINLEEDEWGDFMSNIARRMRQNSEEDLYAAIGYGGLTVASCMPKIKEDYTKLRASAEPKQVQLKAKPPRATDGVIVEGIDNCLVKFAKCCSPLPGDDIIGFVTRGFGVSIHKRHCSNVAASLKDPTNADRWVHAYWEENIKESYKATVIIDALDRDGLLSDVAINLGDMRVPIYAINGRPTENGVAQLSITIGINNTEHLNNVVTRLRKIKDVFKITRS